MYSYVTVTRLLQKKSITMDDLQDYPYLTYEQGEYNSQYFSEEFVSTLDSRKNIRVRDRATLFNLIIGLNGYTVCSGSDFRRAEWKEYYIKAT